MQEGFRHFEFPMHGGWRNFQRSSRLVIGEPSETEKLNDLSFSRIVRRQSLQSEIQLQDSGPTLGSDHDRFIELNLFRSASAFLAVVRFGMVDQNAPEHPRSHCKEMHTALPFDVCTYQSHIGFIYQSRGSQGMIWTFGAQAFCRQPVHLVVDHRHQLIESAFVARAPLLQKTRN